MNKKVIIKLIFSYQHWFIKMLTKCRFWFSETKGIDMQRFYDHYFSQSFNFLEHWFSHTILYSLHVT